MEEFVRQLLPIVPCLFLATPAFADAAGAQRLADDLARYVGHAAFEKHILSVSPEGDAYKITVDFKALTAAVSPMDPGAKIALTPLTLLVKASPDGTWDVNSDSWPAGSIEFDGPQGHQSTQWSLDRAKFNGVFDPALGGFRTGTASQNGMSLSSKEDKQEVHATIGAGTATMSGVPAAGGGMDFTLTEAFADFVEDLQVADPSSGASMPMKMKASKLSIEASARGYRTRALLDLVAYAVNAAEKNLKPPAEEVRQQLRPVLPIWDHLDAAYSFADFLVETPVGAFGASTMGVGMGLDGAIQNAAMNYKMSAAGLSAPMELVPTWAQPLLPTDFDINVGAVGLNLDSAAQKLVENLDITRDPPVPQEVMDQIGAEFMTNPPKVVISKSSVRNKDTEVVAEGEVTFPAGKPEAKIAFEVAGYDKIITAIEASAKDHPENAQILPVALAAKGFAKTLPDGKLRWELTVKGDGSVSVNGVTLKGPDAAQPQ
jgi:hypothetical protein